jgi:hypothetical protein
VTRFEAWLLHLANLLVGGTGIAYAVVRYLLDPPDPFASVHPWQGPVAHAHVLAAPLLVFGLGLVFRAHAWAGVQLEVGARRRSGLVLVASAAPMIVSGYLLQVAIEPLWRSLWSWLHLATGALWLGAAVAHLVASRERVPRAGE